jgi:hypothetical protein
MQQSVGTAPGLRLIPLPHQRSIDPIDFGFNAIYRILQLRYQPTGASQLSLKLLFKIEGQQWSQA